MKICRGQCEAGGAGFELGGAEQVLPGARESSADVDMVGKASGGAGWGQVLPGRKGKQCRERWHNHLNPDIIKVGGHDVECMTQ